MRCLPALQTSRHRRKAWREKAGCYRHLVLLPQLTALRLARHRLPIVQYRGGSVCTSFFVGRFPGLPLHRAGVPTGDQRPRHTRPWRYAQSAGQVQHPGITYYPVQRRSSAGETGSAQHGHSRRNYRYINCFVGVLRPRVPAPFLWPTDYSGKRQTREVNGFYYPVWSDNDVLHDGVPNGNPFSSPSATASTT